MFLIVISVIVVNLLIMWKCQGHVQFDELCLGAEFIQKQLYLCINSNALKWQQAVIKMHELFFFLVILRVLIAYLQSYSRVKFSCKLASEERTCKVTINKFVSVSLNLKLEFNNHVKQNNIFTSEQMKIQNFAFQKQPSRSVLRKCCSENIQQIYRRTPMPKRDL